jgi:hypothetical protein
MAAKMSAMPVTKHVDRRTYCISSEPSVTNNLMWVTFTMQFSYVDLIDLRAISASRAPLPDVSMFAVRAHNLLSCELSGIAAIHHSTRQDVPRSRVHLALLAFQLQSHVPVFCFTKQTLWPESANELHWPSDSRLSAKLVSTFCG